MRNLQTNSQMGVLLTNWFVSFVVATIIFVIPCHAESSEADNLDTIVLQLKWRHQFQFAGYYAALEQGYYRDAGLEVDLRELHPGQDVIEEVLSGRSDYGIANVSLLEARLKGKPVVALATIFQHPAIVFLTLENSGITSPADMIGKKVLVGPSGLPHALAMLRNEGISSEQVTFIPYSEWSLNALTEGTCDVFGAYVTNEPFVLARAGVRTNTIFPRSYGVDFYEDTLFTSEQTIQRHSERTQRFIAATLKGWEYALKHPDEIIDLLLETYKCEKSRDLLEFEAREVRKLIMPELIEIGQMNPGRWQHMADTLQEFDMADSANIAGFVYNPEKDRQERLERTWKWLAIALGVALSLGCLALLWARTLRRQVGTRTRELAESEIRFN